MHLYSSHRSLLQAAPASDRTALESQVEPLKRVAKAHEDDKASYARMIAEELFEDFLRVEERFAGSKEATEQEVIDSMRRVIDLSSHLPHEGLPLRCHSLYLSAFGF